MKYDPEGRNFLLMLIFLFVIAIIAIAIIIFWLVRPNHRGNASKQSVIMFLWSSKSCGSAWAALGETSKTYHGFWKLLPVKSCKRLVPRTGRANGYIQAGINGNLVDDRAKIEVLFEFLFETKWEMPNANNQRRCDSTEAIKNFLIYSS